MLAAAKLVAVLVFASGFLLTRVELTERSACGDFRVEDVRGDGGGDVGEGCWTGTPLDKVVLLNNRRRALRLREPHLFRGERRGERERREAALDW
jgi:hypothetical protein